MTLNNHHHHHHRHRHIDGGQAAVELALALPLLCLLLLGVVQIAVVVRDQLVVIEAARVGARAAAVSGDPVQAGEAAAHRAALAGRVTVSAHTGYVTVVVSKTNLTDVPLVGVLLPDVEVTGSATMLLEPP